MMLTSNNMAVTVFDVHEEKRMIGYQVGIIMEFCERGGMDRDIFLRSKAKPEPKYYS
jgi:hypothetical protein